MTELEKRLEERKKVKQISAWKGN